MHYLYCIIIICISALRHIDKVTQTLDLNQLRISDDKLGQMVKSDSKDLI